MTADIVSLLLFSHLYGAAILGILVVASFAVLLRHEARFYKPMALSVAVGTGFQFVSGSLLALQSLSQVSLLSFCSKIGLYLLVIMIVETLLFKRLHTEKGNYFPLKTVISSIIVGMFFVLFTIFHL